MFELGNFEVYPILYIFISISGIFLSRFNLIIMLLALDIIIFSITLLFIYSSLINLDIFGQIYAFLLLPIAASETALGLGLLVVWYKHSTSSTFVERV